MTCDRYTETSNNNLEYKDRESDGFEMIFVAQSRGRCRALLIKVIDLWFLFKKFPLNRNKLNYSF
jgi:hypothetical protein